MTLPWHYHGITMVKYYMQNQFLYIVLLLSLLPLPVNSSLKARKVALHQMVGKTIMYTAIGADWRQFGHPRKRRPLDSVILDHGVSEAILADIREFIEIPQWYMDRGECRSRPYCCYNW